jgi:hypothetical protein
MFSECHTDKCKFDKSDPFTRAFNPITGGGLWLYMLPNYVCYAVPTPQWFWETAVLLSKLCRLKGTGFDGRMDDSDEKYRIVRCISKIIQLIYVTKYLRCFAQSPIHVTSRTVPTATRSDGVSVHNKKSHIVVQPVASHTSQSPTQTSYCSTAKFRKFCSMISRRVRSSYQGLMIWRTRKRNFVVWQACREFRFHYRTKNRPGTNLLRTLETPGPYFGPKTGIPDWCTLISFSRF